MSIASAQVSDDFSDGNFNIGTAWTGNDALFAVMDDSGNQRLRSASPGAANYYLSTPSTIVDDAQWELWFDLRFNPSGANYVDVYLMSATADLSAGVNGYFVRIGGTDDRIELFRSDGGAAVSLGVQCPDDLLNSSANLFRLKVTRSSAALFTLYYDDGATGAYVNAGSTTDATHASATHFGIRIEQSTAASAVNNHFFDDIAVAPIPVDNTPPELLTATIVSDTQIDLTFNEPLEQTTAEEENNYSIIPFNSAASVVLDGADPTLVHLTLAIAMQNGNTYTITANGVEDLAGNACANETADVTYLIPEVALPGEVIINEIMADPSPVVGLPDAEFVEIHNTTADKTFDLAGWTFSDGGTTGTLPGIILPPGGYAILTDDANAALFAGFGTVASINTFPSINNDGDPLSLSNDAATVIDAVAFELEWYNDDAKDDGGWTLERKDPTAPCSSASNWTASNAAQGGTPGAQNSVFAIVPDNTSPTLLNVLVSSATSVVLVFNEAMDAASLGSGNYAFDPGLSIAQVLVVNSSTVELVLSTPLVVGSLYTVTVTNVSDCPGNAITGGNTASFALPEPVEPGDVLINEVLYDPIGTGSDFVELYNRSSKTLSLAGWKLGNVSEGAVDDVLTITGASFLLLPGAYALICESTANIVSNYPQSRTERFVETDLPSYNNGEGGVVLQAPDGTQLDRFDYTDDLHFALVNETEGYSLERISPDRPTSDNTNWQTASDVAGKATPGFQNSQYAPTANASGEMSIDPAIFSPDNDGFEDVLTIAYRFDQAGFVGTLSVFDIAGREVRTLMENQLLGTEGAISWNGLLDDGSLGRLGPYIVVFEVFDLEGNTELYKKTVTLAHKLN
ncbi:MAG: lamin tail domain-containing protein [Flavobacteriales bacterium]|nr:lamin tail domain-containing protein [Flavobacteriales bacterium]